MPRATPYTDLLLAKVASSPQPPKREAGTYAGRRVELVDGPYVRNHISTEFVGAGNHRAEPYIPKDELWVEESIAKDDPGEVEPLLRHEAVEERNMKKGDDYADAHLTATREEAKERHKTAAMDHHGKSGEKWIGVDFDGTLASYDGWVGPHHVGEPVRRMVRRVRDWLANGREVKIVTARVHPDNDETDTKVARLAIDNFCLRKFGRTLEIRHDKDPMMEQLWDDRAVQVEPNTGRRMDGKHQKAASLLPLEKLAQVPPVSKVGNPWIYGALGATALGGIGSILAPRRYKGLATLMGLLGGGAAGALWANSDAKPSAPVPPKPEPPVEKTPPVAMPPPPEAGPMPPPPPAPVEQPRQGLTAQGTAGSVLKNAVGAAIPAGTIFGSFQVGKPGALGTLGAGASGLMTYNDLKILGSGNASADDKLAAGTSIVGMAPMTVNSMKAVANGPRVSKVVQPAIKALSPAAAAAIAAKAPNLARLGGAPGMIPYAGYLAGRMQASIGEEGDVEGDYARALSGKPVDDKGQLATVAQRMGRTVTRQPVIHGALGLGKSLLGMEDNLAERLPNDNERDASRILAAAAAHSNQPLSIGADPKTGATTVTTQGGSYPLIDANGNMAEQAVRLINSSGLPLVQLDNGAVVPDQRYPAGRVYWNDISKELRDAEERRMPLTQKLVHQVRGIPSKMEDEFGGVRRGVVNALTGAANGEGSTMFADPVPVDIAEQWMAARKGAVK